MNAKWVKRFVICWFALKGGNQWKLEDAVKNSVVKTDWKKGDTIKFEFGDKNENVTKVTKKTV